MLGVLLPQGRSQPSCMHWPQSLFGQIPPEPSEALGMGKAGVPLPVVSKGGLDMMLPIVPPLGEGH